MTRKVKIMIIVGLVILVIATFAYFRNKKNKAEAAKAAEDARLADIAAKNKAAMDKIREDRIKQIKSGYAKPVADTGPANGGASATA